MFSTEQGAVRGCGDGVGEADDVLDGVGFSPGGRVEADGAEAFGPVPRRTPQGRREGQTARGLFAPVAEQAFEGRAKGGEVGDAVAPFGRGKDADHGASDARAGPENARGEAAKDLDVGEGLDEDADGPVVARGGGGGEAVGHFLLDREDEPLGHRAGDEEFGDERRGGGEGEIGDEFQRAADRSLPREDPFDHGGREGVLVLERVGAEEVEVRGVGEAFACDVGEARVEFDGDDPSGLLDEEVGEVADAGADFEDGVGRGEFGLGHEEAHEVAVDEEVLAEPSVGPEAGVGEKGADFVLGGRMGHGAAFDGST